MSEFAEGPPSEPSATGEVRYVSTQQVAGALGVSVSTVKRWVDEGALPAHRTHGGHRKLLIADVIRLAREKNLPQADLSRLLPIPRSLDLSNAAAILEQLSDALKDFNAKLVRALIHGAYHHGYSMEALADRIIAPAMFRIGKEWEAGKIGVFHEHRSTQSVVSALYELKSQLRTQAGPNRPVAVGGAPEGDHSILPTLLAKMVLLDSGWDAINLGPHTPMKAFHVALNDLQPRMMWMSASHLLEPTRFVTEYTALYRHAQERGVPIAIGGIALTEEIRCQLPYTAFGDGLSHLSAFAKSLYSAPVPLRRGRPVEGE